MDGTGEGGAPSRREPPVGTDDHGHSPVRRRRGRRVMNDFRTNPEAAAAELLAGLPDDFLRLSIPQLRAVGEALQAIGEAMLEVADAQQEVLDRLRSRMTSSEQSIGEVATEAEVA